MHLLLRLLPWCALATPWLVLAWRGLQFPAGDDWQLELARVAAYLHAWQDGQWLPFWAPDLYAGYGSPIFLFYGHGFVSLAALASLALRGGLGSGFLAALVCFGGVGVWGMQLLASGPADLAPQQRARAGRVAVYLFVLNPYLIADLLVRNAAAEYSALCLAPFALYGLCYGAAVPRRAGAWLCLCVGCAALLITHLLTTLALGAVLLALGPAVLARSRQRWMRLGDWGLGALIALGLSAFVWLPILVFSPLIRTHDLVTGKFAYAASLLAPGQLLSLANAYGAGPLPYLALLLAGWTALELRRSARSDATPYAAVLLVCAVVWAIQTDWAWPLVRQVPGLRLFQFSFRFMGPLALLSAWVGGRAFAWRVRELGPRCSTALELLVFVLCLGCAAPQLARAHTVPWTQVTRLQQLLAADHMRTLLLRATAADEYLPRGAEAAAIRAPAGPVPVAHASGGLRVAVRSAEPRHIVLDVRAPGASQLCLARWAFPFWTLRVDERAVRVSGCDDQTLRVPVPAGKHRIRAELNTPRPRRWGLLVSALTALACAAWTLARRTRRTAHES